MEAKSTVYVVDDDLALRESLRDLLHSANLRAEIFADAQAFFDAYDAEKPACLLLDIRMPGIDGWDVQQTLVARKVTLPVIFITGHGDVPLAVRALKNGAFDFIEKPFRFQTLLPRIQEATAQDIKLRHQNAQLAKGRTKLDQLTRREREVL